MLVVRKGRRFQRGLAIDVEDVLAKEIEVEVVVEGLSSVKLWTSPYMLYELGLGYAYSEGFDVSRTDIVVEGTKITIRGAAPRTISRPIGETSINATKLLELYRSISSEARLSRATGCFHFVGIADPRGKVQLVVEDISRFCALDKAIGRLLVEGSDPRNYIAILSSRATRRLVEKIARCGIAIAAFRGAPTDEAIEEAKQRGMTLIAYLREDRFTVYTHIYRVLF